MTFLGGIKTYSDLLYIFRGSGPPQPAMIYTPLRMTLHFNSLSCSEIIFYDYLHQGGYVFIGVCLFVTYLKVKSAKCLCLLPVVLVLLFWSWSWSCKQRSWSWSWSWSCYFGLGLGLGLKNLVLFASLVMLHRRSSTSEVHDSRRHLCDMTST